MKTEIAVVGSFSLIGKKDFPHRENLGDVDFVGTYEACEKMISLRKKFANAQVYPSSNGNKLIVKGGPVVPWELEIAWPGSSGEEFLNLVSEDPETIQNAYGNASFPSLDALYAIKMSHRYLKNSKHFLKTMKDIRYFRSKGAKLSGRYYEWYRRREKETYSYKHPNLKQSKNNFFAGSVEQVYDHDSIHEAVAFGSCPAYLLYKKDGAEVECDRGKWENLSDEVKLHGVVEEALVLALERSQIPFPETDKIRSFKMALEKVCTSITSGWFREWAWEHYFEAVGLFEKMGESGEDYVSLFNRKLSEGVVKKI